MTTFDLNLAILQSKISTNAGRLTAESSMDLDHWHDQAEEIKKIPAERMVTGDSDSQGAVIYLHQPHFGPTTEWLPPFDPFNAPDGPCSSAKAEQTLLNFHVFGSERIVDLAGKVVASGIVTHVHGSVKLLRVYFSDKGDVWTCSNPMSGDWILNTVVKNG